MARSTEMVSELARPTDYTEDLADSICRQIAAGSNLSRLGQDEAFPASDTLYRWRNEKPEFSGKYLRAREMRADSRSDRMDDYVSRMLGGELDPNAVRVALLNEQWQAGREAPKKYGDKIQQEISGPGGKPIETKDVSDRDRAKAIAAVVAKAKS